MSDTRALPGLPTSGPKRLIAVGLVLLGVMSIVRLITGFDDLTSSGTIGAALAAEHTGLCAVALSQAFRGPAETADFSPAIAYGQRVVAQLLAGAARDEAGRFRGAWSVNFPAARDETPIQGIGWARGARVPPRCVSPIRRESNMILYHKFIRL